MRCPQPCLRTIETGNALPATTTPHTTHHVDARTNQFGRIADEGIVKKSSGKLVGGEDAFGEIVAEIGGGHLDALVAHVDDVRVGNASALRACPRVGANLRVVCVCVCV
jgi:hypothetical protein